MEIQKSRGPTIDRAKQEAERKAAEPAQQAYAAQQAQQQEAYAAHQQQQAAAVDSTASSADALPAGWMALQDPASGHYYYANQVTGEVTWERPQTAPAPQPAAVRAANPQPELQPTEASTPNGRRSVNNLASKYGDGFVTSSSHPELASQYGNVGTRYERHGQIFSINGQPILKSHASCTLAVQQSIQYAFTAGDSPSFGCCQTTRVS